MANSLSNLTIPKTDGTSDKSVLTSAQNRVAPVAPQAPKTPLKAGTYSPDQYFQGQHQAPGYNVGDNSRNLGDTFSDAGDAVLGAFGFGESASGAALRRLQDQLVALQLPELQNVKYTDFKSVGDYRDYVTKQKDTALKNLNLDPTGRNAQVDALDQMRAIAAAGGLTMQDKATLAQMESDAGAKERGSREAITQNAQARGLGSSDLSLANQLSNSQGAASDRSQRELDVAAQAQQRALDAIRQSSEMGGTLRSSDYQQAADAANAQDVINRFNAGNLTSAGQNTLQSKQNIANTNTGLRNSEADTNRMTDLQNYQNIVNRNLLIGNVAQGQAGMKDAMAANNFVGNQLRGTADLPLKTLQSASQSAGEAAGKGVAAGLL